MTTIQVQIEAELQRHQRAIEVLETLRNGILGLEELNLQSDEETIANIKLAVCLKHRITEEQLVGKSRTAAIVIARDEAMALVKALNNRTLREIGFLFGGRDHSTVLLAVGRHQSQNPR